MKPLIRNDQTRFLTWLPLSHSYEHTVQFVQITVEARVFYAESIDKLIKNMNDCSPEIMTAVPRFYQNLYQKINASFNKATGLKKILIKKMLNLGLKKIQKEPLNFIEKIQDSILDKIVRKKPTSLSNAPPPETKVFKEPPNCAFIFFLTIFSRMLSNIFSIKPKGSFLIFFNPKLSIF